MGQALYRKYRSKKLSDIVGQKPVTTALSNALKKGQISHAYLFTGPRGVGKTSVARILAHEINDINYISDEMSIDIIEIDAASNRRIDEIRDLREKVNIAPVSAKYKVYIIDEVHMLTREAFNALLKTLEEPPKHVIFILATTEAHKIPETIISRTQRYSFKLAALFEVKELLSDIAKKEEIDIDEDSLQLIAEHSEGSLRDSLSLLDQIRHSGIKINSDIVRQNLGLPSKELVTRLLQALKGEPADLINELQKAKEEGSPSTLLAGQIIQELRRYIITKEPVLPLQESTQLIKSLMAVSTSSQPSVQLEIALLETQFNYNPIKLPAPESKISAETAQLVTESSKKSKTVDKKVEQSTIKPKTTAILSDKNWVEVLNTIKGSHNTIYGILRMAKPDYSQLSNNTLILRFKFPFHQKRISIARNKKIITDTLKKFNLNDYEIICKLIDKRPKIDQPVTSLKKSTDKLAPSVDQIRNVFGGAEVLE